MDKICCFTGKRNIPSEQKETLQSFLESTFKEMLGYGVTVFNVAAGEEWGSMAALAALRHKTQSPQLQLRLFLPPSGAWPGLDPDVLAEANEITRLEEGFFAGCGERRSRSLVANSDFCICNAGEEGALN